MTNLTLSEMKTYYEGRVQEADIDNLGHMNVRVYARKAAEATHALIASIGLDGAALVADGSVVQILEGHTRFYREQLEGAPLQVRGGVLEAESGSLAVYLELINADNGDLAATFRNVATLHDRASRDTRSFGSDILSAAQESVVDWPEHGRPRSLPLTPMRPHVSLGDIEEAGLIARFKPYVVREAECDAQGFMDLSGGEALAFYGTPIKWPRQDSAHASDDPERGSIATVESRQVVFAVPRAGDTLVTHSVIVEVGTKSMQFRHWTFDAEKGNPFSVHAQFGLGFDLEARRSAEFPAPMHASLSDNARPEFA